MKKKVSNCQKKPLPQRDVRREKNSVENHLGKKNIEEKKKR